MPSTDTTAIVITRLRSRREPFPPGRSSPTTASGNAAGCLLSYDARTRPASFPALSPTKYFVPTRVDTNMPVGASATPATLSFCISSNRTETSRSVAVHKPGSVRTWCSIAFAAGVGWVESDERLLAMTAPPAARSNAPTTTYPHCFLDKTLFMEKDLDIGKARADLRSLAASRTVYDGPCGRAFGAT